MASAGYRLPENANPETTVIGDVLATLRRGFGEFEAAERPWTTLTYAQSLDGSIAGPGHKTVVLSNRLSMTMTHQLRDFHDAVLVGINTVMSDDPRLTVRLVEGRNPQPVVLDRQLRFPLSAKLLRDPCVCPIIVCSHTASHLQEKQLRNLGAKVLRVATGSDGLLSLVDLLRHLKLSGLSSIMVEGGSRVISGFLAAGLVDQVILTVSPQFVGGVRGVEPFEVGTPNPVSRLYNIRYFQLDEDLIVTGKVSKATHSDVHIGLKKVAAGCTVAAR